MHELCFSHFKSFILWHEIFSLGWAQMLSLLFWPKPQALTGVPFVWPLKQEQKGSASLDFKIPESSSSLVICSSSMPRVSTLSLFWKRKGAGWKKNYMLPRPICALHTQPYQCTSGVSVLQSAPCFFLPWTYQSSHDPTLSSIWGPCTYCSHLCNQLPPPLNCAGTLKCSKFPRVETNTVSDSLLQGSERKEPDIKDL